MKTALSVALILAAIGAATVGLKAVCDPEGRGIRTALACGITAFTCLGAVVWLWA